jgi:hypothetical protein
MLFFAAGCSSTRQSSERAVNAADDTPKVSLGQVSTSGSGLMPSYPALKLTLRHMAARQFNVPVDEIVVGSIELNGGRELGARPAESGGFANVLTPVNEESGSWTATAEVSRKVAKQS